MIYVVCGIGKDVRKPIVQAFKSEQKAINAQEEMKLFFAKGSQESYYVHIYEIEPE
jgi:hypothetical protein